MKTHHAIVILSVELIKQIEITATAMENQMIKIAIYKIKQLNSVGKDRQLLLRVKMPTYVFSVSN